MDFSVKEIMLAYFAMKDKVPPAKREEWKELLSKIDVYKNYTQWRRTTEEAMRLSNINVYNMVGEYLREKEGMTDTAEYFDIHWPAQLKRFDENGMYMDPGCPLLYDLTTRCQIQIMIGMGYRGKFFESLDANLKKAGLWTLFMQSSSYELPFGGRSNQFLFNEGLIAANCEYEAVRYKKEGDLKLAGMFKRSARLAALSIKRWLGAKPPRHIKNFYPVESLHGTEGYGYYDKYMMTLGCFIYIAYLFADDSIEEYPCPAEAGGYIVKTSDDFHMVFANCRGNSIQINTKADFRYDSTGLGRYHRRGFPTELALSVPFTAAPNYNLAKGLKSTNLAIGPGWQDENGKVQYLSELSENLNNTIELGCISKDLVSFTVTYTGECFKGCRGVREEYNIDSTGVTIETELIAPDTNKIFYRVPLFMFNGRDKSNISVDKNIAYVKLDDYVYKVDANDNSINLSDEIYSNRNGEYRPAIITAECGKISLRLELTEAK